MTKKYLLIALAIWIAAACTQQKTKATADGNDIKTDSVGCVINKQGIKVAISTDYPVEGEALQQAVAGFIIAQMDLEDSLKAYPPDNGQELVRQLAEAKYKDLKGLVSQNEDTPVRQDDAEPSTTFSADFKCVYETDDYLSLQGHWDSFVEGTPHPNDGICGITLRKSDGKSLGLSDILKNTDGKAFRQQLKTGIRKWLSEITETSVTTDEDMKKLLGDEIDPDNMPLPESAPFLIKEGIALPYGSYELIPNEPALIVIPFSADYCAIETLK